MCVCQSAVKTPSTAIHKEKSRLENFSHLVARKGMGPLKYGAPTSCGVRFCAYADGIVVAIRTMTCCARHLSLPASTPLELPPGDGVRYGSGLTQAAGVRRSAGVCLPCHIAMNDSINQVRVRTAQQCQAEAASSNNNNNKTNTKHTGKVHSIPILLTMFHDDWQERVQAWYRQ